jgi:sensor c-di-GMP phosphodiesterase-like protein
MINPDKTPADMHAAITRLRGEIYNILIDDFGLSA